MSSNRDRQWNFIGGLVKEITTEALIQEKAHIGELSANWNPLMKKYIFGVIKSPRGRREKRHIINVESILEQFGVVENEIRECIKNDENILFVGTKQVFRGVLEALGEYLILEEKVNVSFVTHRWIGGTLTNNRNIILSVKKLRQLERELLDPESRSKLNKKEISQKTTELIRLRKIYGGLRTLRRQPKLVFVIDGINEMTAIQEARQMNIRLVGAVNTNANPSLLDVVLPINDANEKPIKFLLNWIKEVIMDEVLKKRAADRNLSPEEYKQQLEEETNVEKLLRKSTEDIVSDEESTVTQSPQVEGKE